MVSMSYCRHENTVAELEQVLDKWHDYTPGDDTYEDDARQDLIQLCKDILYEAGESMEQLL